MADIILPDDVFENMQHAQETAEKMNAAVTDFNKKVDEKFKGEDASNKAKFKQKINPILSPDEKKRYRNIGNSFFEGAKNQIIDIFKQIEENKKKSSFKHAVASINEKVKQIKETAEEKNTGKKILLAIAAIGGIYVLFKGWFDKNMPEIWEKMKDAVTTFANSAVSFAEQISKAVANSEIFENIKNFVSKTGDTIVRFFREVGDTLTGLFSSSESSPKTITYNNRERAQKEIDEANEKYKDNELVKMMLEHTGWDYYTKNRLLLAEGIDELRKAKERGEKTYIENGRPIDIDTWLNSKTNELNKFNEHAPLLLEEVERFSSGFIDHMQNILKNGDQTLPKKAIELRNAGDMRGAIGELLKNGYLQDYFKNADTTYISKDFMESVIYVADTLAKNPNWDGKKAPEFFKFNSTAQSQYNQAMPLIEMLTNQTLDQFEGIADAGSETPDESAKPQKEGQEQQKDNKTRIQNTNYAKLTHVAVITSLDEFVRNFFEGNGPGSFKNFSETFLTSIKEIADNFKIGVTVAKHINSLHDKVNSLIYKADENFEVIVETLNNGTQSVKEFISEKFEENNASYLNDRLQDIISKEQEQIDCLSEQNKILKETNSLLSNVGNKNNSYIISPQNGGNNIDVSNTPTTNTSPAVISIVTGEMQGT